MSFNPQEKSNVYLNGESTSVQPGDVLCLEAGVYSTIRMVNIHGTRENPIVVKNCGGKAEIDLRGGTSHGFILNTSTNVHITGTGEQGIEHGIEIYREPADPAKTGMAIADRVSDIELDHIEIHDVELGLHLLNVPNCDMSTWQENWVMENVRVHDFYVHDVGNEGFYIGSSKYGTGHTQTCDGTTVSLLPPNIKHIQVYNNSIRNSGWDAMQVSVAVEDCKVFNNSAVNWGMKNKPSQRAGLVIGGGSTGDVFGNYIAMGEGDGIDVFGIGNVRIFNNIIAGAKGQGIFIGNREPFSGYNYYLINNTIVDSGEDAIRYNNEFAQGSKIVNNLLVGFGQKAVNLVKQGPGGVDTAANLELGAVADAHFTDANNGDYSILETSPAVDAGVDILPLNVLFTDYFSVPRPVGSGVDVGAAEFSSDGNRAPQINIWLADQQTMSNSVYHHALAANTFSDPDGDSFSLSASRADDSILPAWLLFSADDLTFSGVPGDGDAGIVVIKLTATDSKGAASSQLFRLEVMPTAQKSSILYLSLPAMMQ